ncbi:arabinose efflux permease family protein [Saccharomonospora marina XMU15]|uniref:Arabinose efflux permease family protein n=1 Tax=Saccharomonospora marina XMU15 TaxID=882083 RepID=H5X7F2_9PSEU|nr:arabinose efflux permease family protein [Saccharomonospora marina XMU15]
MPWRRLLPTALIPNVLHGAAQGAAVPTIPLAAVSLTGSSATAALVAAMLTVGQLPLTLPAGWLVARFGERPAMLAGTAATGSGALCAYLASSPAILTLGVLLIGVGVAVFAMARHAWITASVAGVVRGRSLAALAGATRLGMFAGPFLAAAAFQLCGEARGGFLTVVAMSGLLAVVVSCVSFPKPDGGETEPRQSPNVLRTMWQRRDVLLRLGLTISVVSTMRHTRRILVPLVGTSVGLDDVTVAVVMGLASGVDFSLFYLGGVVADRWGRLPVALSALVGFGLSHLGLALATQLPAGQWWYLASTMVMAMANGWSGGVVATVGSDLADPRSPAPFLSSWRLTTELGSAVAPLAVAALAGAISLPAACAMLAILAGAGAAALPSSFRRHLPGELS